MATPHIVASHQLASGRFLKLECMDYTDEQGTMRHWEVANRQKNQQAVFIIARLVPSNRYVLIRQFRVPVGQYCIEVPAGLVDDGESVMQAAVRELEEETGYLGTVDWTGPAAASTAGMAGELVSTALMTVDETLPVNTHPVQHPDEGENIQVFLISKEHLGDFLKEAVQKGDIPDSRLVAWMIGMGV